MSKIFRIKLNCKSKSKSWKRVRRKWEDEAETEVIESDLEEDEAWSWCVEIWFCPWRIMKEEEMAQIEKEDERRKTLGRGGNIRHRNYREKVWSVIGARRQGSKRKKKM